MKQVGEHASKMLTEMASDTSRPRRACIEQLKAENKQLREACQWAENALLGLMADLEYGERRKPDEDERIAYRKVREALLKARGEQEWVKRNYT